MAQVHQRVLALSTWLWAQPTGTTVGVRRLPRCALRSWTPLGPRGLRTRSRLNSEPLRALAIRCASRASRSRKPFPPTPRRRLRPIRRRATSSRALPLLRRRATSSRALPLLRRRATFSRALPLLGHHRLQPWPNRRWIRRLQRPSGSPAARRRHPHRRRCARVRVRDAAFARAANERHGMPAEP